jgi:hypothetical protein
MLATAREKGCQRADAAPSLEDGLASVRSAALKKNRPPNGGPVLSFELLELELSGSEPVTWP